MNAIFSILLLIFSIPNTQEELMVKDMPSKDIQLIHKEVSADFIEVFNSLTEEVDEEGLTIVNDPEDIEVVVNKERRLPDGYEPGDLVEANVPYLAPADDPKRLIREEAAEALEELFAGAAEQGLELVAVSGYRSYDRQAIIYENNVSQHGEDYTNQFSAKPGTSEHQTGLAMDVASAAQVAVLEQAFIETDEGQWLDEHAHEYGFIIRYPEGKEEITGYSYEPWHLRYVGEELAEEVYQAEETLEEYFGLIDGE